MVKRDNKKRIEEYKDHLEKLRSVAEFHVLSAAKFIEETYVIERMIKSIEKEMNEEKE